MKADIHIHTKYSACSNAKIKDVLKTAQRKGLNTIAIMDHNTIKGALIAKKTNPYPDLDIIVGCEKKCEYGELLIYNLKKEIKSNKFIDILKEARKQKAYVFIAHPFDWIRFNNKWKNFNRKIIGSIDGIEVLNGRNLFNNKSEKLYNNSTLKGVAGSDAHYTEEIGNTYVKYNKDLWKEIFKKKVNFVSFNRTYNKLKYLIKSFINKWIK